MCRVHGPCRQLRSASGTCSPDHRSHRQRARYARDPASLAARPARSSLARAHGAPPGIPWKPDVAEGVVHDRAPHQLDSCCSACSLSHVCRSTRDGLVPRKNRPCDATASSSLAGCGACKDPRERLQSFCSTQPTCLFGHTGLPPSEAASQSILFSIECSRSRPAFPLPLGVIDGKGQEVDGADIL